jgi:hypothetical protein
MIFELLVNRDAVSRAHDPSVKRSVFFDSDTFATHCGQIFHALASQERQQEGIAIEMQGQKRSSRRRLLR